MNKMIKSIKLAFKTKNIFCRVLIIFWLLTCALMTFAFFIGTGGSVAAEDIFLILILYYFSSTAFLMPAVSISQGVNASQSSKHYQSSEKSWGLTLFFSIFLGHLGIHRFYVGKKATGVLYILSFCGFGIGWITDIILILGDKFTDKDGNIISRKKHINTQVDTPAVDDLIEEDTAQRQMLLQQAASRRIGLSATLNDYQPAMDFLSAGSSSGAVAVGIQSHKRTISLCAESFVVPEDEHKATEVWFQKIYSDLLIYTTK